MLHKQSIESHPGHPRNIDSSYNFIFTEWQNDRISNFFFIIMFIFFFYNDPMTSELGRIERGNFIKDFRWMHSMPYNKCHKPNAQRRVMANLKFIETTPVAFSDSKNFKDINFPDYLSNLIRKMRASESIAGFAWTHNDSMIQNLIHTAIEYYSTS